MRAPADVHPTSVVSPEAVFGAGCRVGPAAVVGPGVSCGNRVEVGAGVLLTAHCRLGDDVVLDAGCSLHGGTDEAPLVIESGVHVMTGAVIAAGVTIATGARVMPGAVVLKPVPPHAVVAGNPAQITGYASTLPDTPPPLRPSTTTTMPGASPTSVRGVTLHRFPRILDLRGNLSVGEFDRTVPFAPKRYFVVFDVPNAEIRGEHAHRRCHQFLVCTHGRCNIVADDGHAREEFILDDPAVGLYLPPMTWGVQYKYSADGVLLVFASEFYDPDDYIRDYHAFVALARQA